MAIPDRLDCSERILVVCEHPSDLLLMTAWHVPAICAPCSVTTRLELAIAQIAWQPKEVVFLLSGWNTSMWEDQRLWRAFGLLTVPVRIIGPTAGNLSFANMAEKAHSPQQAKCEFKNRIAVAPRLRKGRSVVKALDRLEGHGRVPDLFRFAA
jgi:hypothetical protein